MKTPFLLRKTPPEPASALLLPGNDVPALLHLCAALGPALPTIHRVADGFLIRLPPGRTPDALPGAIRLRALSTNLFVPVDAALTPALLPDEVRALVRQRGLLFLPGDVVREFSPTVLLSADELLGLPVRPPRAWQPLPPRPERPEQLHEILLDAPDPPPDAIVEAGGAGIGVEAPRPAAAGPASTLAAGAQSALGQALMRLGALLRLRRLARLGAGMVARAVERVPRISESLLGRQEAALRELLRQFREGNVEDALRRALPLNAAASRGAAPAQDANLPTHNLFYRLGDLLGAGQGPGAVWLAAGNVYHDLESAYRRAAEEAVRRGDYRRAAFIYGKLLQDWRQAAGVLARGGLHRDAAVLYLEKLNDRHAAARAFEAAGEVDRALTLYLQHGEHVLAGDLLMRAGEPERAVDQYIRAANAEALVGRHLAAGNLLVNKKRSDLAEAYLSAGWAGRPAGEAPGCLVRLAELYADKATPAPLLALLAEADAYFAESGNDQHAADFYNRLMVLSARENLASVRDELQDRALLALANRMRQGAAHGRRAGVVSRLFGFAGVWPAALVRDAESALAGLPRPKGPDRADVKRVTTHRATVTSVCAAQETGDLFVGFADGRLAHFNPRNDAVTTWDAGPGEVVALAVDRGGESLVVCTTGTNAVFEVAMFQGRGRTRPHARHNVEATSRPRLTPVAHGPAGRLVGVWNGRDLTLLGVPDLVVVDRLSAASFSAALILEGWPADHPSASTVIFEDDPRLHFLETPSPLPGLGEELHRLRLELPSFATAGLREDAGPLFSWLAPAQTHLEVAYADAGGVLHWLCLRVLAENPKVHAHYQTGGERYLCAALLQPGRAAGVRRDGVAWLSCGERGFLFRSHTQTNLPDAVACFASPLTKELLVLLSAGDVVRVSAPW